MDTPLNIIQLIIVSVIQGITEFLPISSSGHLILIPHYLGSEDQGLIIDIAAHGGTLIAVMLYFWRDVYSLCSGGVDKIKRTHSYDAKLFQFIAVATIPGLTTGALLYFIEPSWLRDPRIVGAASLFFGILLWHSDRQGQDLDQLEKLQWRHVIWIGISQICAFIPGTSRSGITMTAARYFNISRSQAARFSMLLSIPIIGAATCMTLLKIIQDDSLSQSALMPFAIVFFLSFITALIAIDLLLRWVREHSFTPFVIYRVILGLVLLLA